MNTTAYLVLWMDTEHVDRPAVSGAGIYSEPAPTTRLHSKMRPVPILHVNEKDYGRAAQALRQIVFGDPAYGWLVPLMRRSKAA